MPIFDFECKNCETVVEIITSSDEEQKCARCSSPLDKLPSTWGWYSIGGDNSASNTPHKYRKNNVDDNKR